MSLVCLRPLVDRKYVANSHCVLAVSFTDEFIHSLKCWERGHVEPRTSSHASHLRVRPKLASPLREFPPHYILDLLQNGWLCSGIPNLREKVSKQFRFQSGRRGHNLVHYLDGVKASTPRLRLTASSN